MKKLIIGIITFITIAILVFIFIINFELNTGTERNKTYILKNENSKEIQLLNKSVIWNDGILTYESGTIIYKNYNNDVIWQNQDEFDTNDVFVTDKYVYIIKNNNIKAIDKSNNIDEVVEIKGELIDVSRENNKTCIFTKQNDENNLIYILDENNEILVEAKEYKQTITCLSAGNNSDGYCVSYVSIAEGKIINNISYISFEEQELWSQRILDDIIIETEIINNNILIIGLNNIYSYDKTGKLIWQNTNYNKIKDFHINSKLGEIYILYEKSDKLDLIVYDLSGKVKETYEVSQKSGNIKSFDNNIYVLSDKSIYNINSIEENKIWDSEDVILDISVKNNKIVILFENKIMTGKLK